MEVAPFFVDFHHFLSIFTIYALLSRFTHFFRNFFLAKIAFSATSHVFCMYANTSPSAKLMLAHMMMASPGAWLLVIRPQRLIVCWLLWHLPPHPSPPTMQPPLPTMSMKHVNNCNFCRIHLSFLNSKKGKGLEILLFLEMFFVIVSGYFLKSVRSIERTNEVL